ncbi:MAG: hypothetical protein PHU17_02110 [Candidatus Pacebacteria bacterium]|nr:hypothetical protein [Candidatus Paceibacterota bacterium]MDD4074296.1 hypothetical protein [Candidatus Paceibacterota bacterium]
MTKKTKTVRTFYLYTVSLLSLIFLAVGLGNLINTNLKSTFFKEAEKRDYSVCNNYPNYMYSIDTLKNTEYATEDKTEIIDQMIESYKNWEKDNLGEICYKAERERKMVNSLTMILISLPLYAFHWAIIRKERKINEEE